MARPAAIVVFVLLALVLTILADAQIKAEPTYPVYSMIELDVETPEAGFRSIVWEFFPDVSGRQLPDGRFAFTGPPGAYNVLASVVWGERADDRLSIADGCHKLFRASFDIVEASAEPERPAIVEGAAVLIFEQAAARTRETAKLLADVHFWSTVVDRGMIFRTFDIDSDDAKPYAEKIRPIGLPALVVVSKEGTVLAAGRLPTTIEEIDQTINASTGK